MTAALFGTVFGASIVGSLHCIAMCGPLASLAVGNTQGQGRRGWLAAGHALGRLGVYAALGALAGLLGASFNLLGRALEVQRLAVIVAGVTLLAWGLYHGAVALGMRPWAWDNKAYKGSLVRLGKMRPARRALMLGVLSGLMPCGWLWSFTVVAAGTASPLGGLAVMVVFWAGTVPALTGALTLFEPILRYVRVKLPLVTALVILLLGIFTLRMRLPLLDQRAAAALAATKPGEAPPLPACHGGHP